MTKDTNIEVNEGWIKVNGVIIHRRNILVIQEIDREDTTQTATEIKRQEEENDRTVDILHLRPSSIPTTVKGAYSTAEQNASTVLSTIEADGGRPKLDLVKTTVHLFASRQPSLLSLYAEFISLPHITLQPLRIIVNPASGARLSLLIFNSLLVPLLNSIGIKYKAYETTKERDGVRIGETLYQELTEDNALKEDINVVVLGGDGTIHEFLNGLFIQNGTLTLPSFKLNIIPLPFGTANALFHSYAANFPFNHTSNPPTNVVSSDPDAEISERVQLQPLLSYLLSASSPSSNRVPHPLSLALNTLISPSNLDSPTSQILTCIVSSTSLHASILYTSESLRATHPGIERYKIAAGQNSTKWWKGCLRMKNAKRWDNAKIKWEEEIEEVVIGDVGGTSSGRGYGEMERMDGDNVFSYFVASMVDRFEEKFVITPLKTPSPISHSVLDVIFLRPLLHTPTFSAFTTVSHDASSTLPKPAHTSSARAEYVPLLYKVFAGVYNNGSHITRRGDEGKTNGGENERMFTEAGGEYWRCEAFEWIPERMDEWNETPDLVCLDGTLKWLGFEAEKGGKLICRAVDEQLGVGVWF